MLTGEAMQGLKSTSIALAVASLLSGCATTSFAPPNVELTEIRTNSSCRLPTHTGQVNPDQEGAYALTDNFIYAYRCAQREAADGRQIFQVPSFLALIVGTLGPTFGGSQDASVAMAGYGATLAQGNAYFAPKQKAGIIDHGIDALLCIKTEQVEVDFFDTTPDAAAAAEVASLDLELTKIGETMNMMQGQNLASLDAATRARHQADFISLQESYFTLSAHKARRAVAAIAAPVFIQRQLAGATVNIDVERQYHHAVASALLSVERVIASRLGDAGKPDPEAFAALLKKLADDAAAAKKAKEKAAPSNPASLADYGGSATKRDQAYVELSIEDLRAALQVCVLRAKMA